MRKYRGFVAVRKSNMRHKLLNVAEIKAKNSLLYDAVIFMRPTFLYEITKKKNYNLFRCFSRPTEADKIRQDFSGAT